MQLQRRCIIVEVVQSVQDSHSSTDIQRSVGGWTCQPLESPNPEESTKKPVIIAVVIIAAGGAEGQLS
ncbi:hypothetical protein EAG_01785 [Camponotus floridanus]|uniref:Uncharacterized protein n=1 Tax=Camponotus floridanus TaxID=104421 RepID=E2AGJ8_CAMFO|nr:hypothetical protein EAG_01785 [Camponotus floridanus]